MYRNLIATGASAALAAAVLSVTAATAGAVTFPGTPRATATAPSSPKPGPIVLTVRTSSCTEDDHAELTSLTHPGLGVLSSASHGSGKKLTVTARLSAGRWTVSTMTGRSCAKGIDGGTLMPDGRGSTYSAVITIVSPAPAPLPGSGKQEG